MPTKTNIIKIIVLATLFSFVFGCEKDPIIKEVVPNGGFEIWEIKYDSLMPSCWNGGTNVINRTNNAYSGNYAVVIESFAYSSTGTSNGILESRGCTNPNYFYGFSINSRPISLKGFFKYFPAYNDTCRLYVELYYQSSNYGSRKTIAQGILKEGRTIENYTEFRIYLNYKSNTIPNRANIMFVSSDKDIHKGSKIVIDDLKFEYN